MKNVNSWKNSLSRALLVVGCLMLFAVSAQAAGKTVKLAYVEWSSEIASSNVVKAVLQEKMGIRWEIIAMRADEMWEAVAEGEADAMVAAWLPLTHADYYEQFKDDVRDLGPTVQELAFRASIRKWSFCPMRRLRSGQVCDNLDRVGIKRRACLCLPVPARQTGDVREYASAKALVFFAPLRVLSPHCFAAGPRKPAEGG